MDRDLVEVTIPQLHRYYDPHKYTVSQGLCASPRRCMRRSIDTDALDQIRKRSLSSPAMRRLTSSGAVQPRRCTKY